MQNITHQGTIGRSLYKLERTNANPLVRCDEYSDAGRRISDDGTTIGISV